MNCEVLSTLYIRSNGDVPCDDDAGEKIVLGTAPGKNWNVQAHFSNAAYTHIGRSLSAGKAPWPDTCSSCAFFRPNEPFSESISRLEIQKVQVEPSLACNLRCPCCSQAQQIIERPKPFLMTAQHFENIVRSLQEAKYRVREIEYCGQGDPLMNREFPLFVKHARTYFPKTCQRLITNGNFDYWEATGGQAIDEIFVSCDGVRQHSYEQYRVLGKVDRALDFMRTIPRKISTQRQYVVWKYILFEFNDSDEEIREAQDTAQDLKVDALLFVFTHSKFKSQRYKLENAKEFPIYYANVTTNGTPIHYRKQDFQGDDSQLPVTLVQRVLRILKL